MSDSTPIAPPPPEAPVSGGGDLIQPQQPPKDPTIILILNLLVAGCVGYFMIGQKMKGIVALVIYVVGLPLTCGTVSGIVSILAAIDGYFQAEQLKAGFPVAQWTFFKDHR